MNFRIFSFSVAAILALVLDSACGQDPKSNEKADREVATVKKTLDALIERNRERVSESDKAWEREIAKLLNLHEAGSKLAATAILDVAKEEKGTVLRVLRTIRKASEMERQKAIDGLIARIDPPKKKEEVAKKGPTNAEADTAAANLKMGVDTLISYRAGGLPVGDDGFEKGISALLDLHDKGSHKATEFIVQIGLKEKSTSLKVLKALRKDADEERATTIDILVAKIDPKKETKKEEKK